MLREEMAAHGLWKTTELAPLLAERGVTLSAAQTYRLVAGQPERLSLMTLAALCDIFNCTPADLIATSATTTQTPKAKPARPGPRRPRRARITKDH
jgi:DNA-binding Xre family transcriptional regulator